MCELRLPQEVLLPSPDGAPHPRWTVTVPAPCEFLNANDRRHYRLTGALVRQWREAAGWRARHAKLPRLARAYVLAEFRFATRRRRDPANWYPTVKACIDGFVDVGVLPDDSAHHLIGPDMRLGPSTTDRLGMVVFHVWSVDNWPSEVRTR